MMRDKIAEIQKDIVEVRARMSEMASTQVENMLALLRTSPRDSVPAGAAVLEAQNPTPSPSTTTPRPKLQTRGAEGPKPVTEDPTGSPRRGGRSRAREI